MLRLYSIFIFLLSQTKPITQAPFPLEIVKAGWKERKARGVLQRGAGRKSSRSSNKGQLGRRGSPQLWGTISDKALQESPRTPHSWIFIKGRSVLAHVWEWARRDRAATAHLFIPVSALSLPHLHSSFPTRPCSVSVSADSVLCWWLSWLYLWLFHRSCMNYTWGLIVARGGAPDVNR